MNSPKKNKFRSKRSKRIRFVPVISDVSNTPLDAENTELANLIETKVTSGILPQDIVVLPDFSRRSGSIYFVKKQFF